MSEYSKKVKRELRRLRDQAWEAELATALGELEAKFTEWRDGKIGAFELNEHVHRFHQGSSREVYNRYNGLDREIAVARGVALGLIPRESVPEEVLGDIARSIAIFEEHIHQYLAGSIITGMGIDHGQQLGLGHFFARRLVFFGLQ